MDRIIEKISVIEDASKQIMLDANAKKQAIADEIKKQTEEFDRGLEEETAARIAALRTNQEKDMREKLEAQRAGAEQAIKVLENHYVTQRESYVERIFREMTGA